jgi:hypothetical protein
VIPRVARSSSRLARSLVWGATFGGACAAIFLVVLSVRGGVSPEELIMAAAFWIMAAAAGVVVHHRAGLRQP